MASVAAQAVPAHEHHSGRRRRALVLLSAVAVVLCVIAVGATRASALDHYASSGEFGTSAFVGPTKAAVDGATGDVLVVDSGNNQVQVWAPGGASLLTTFGAGALSAPYGIAIDQVTHDVYVSDAGNGRIVRYTTDGLPTPTYTLDGLYAGPAAGADAAGLGQVGSFASPIAVDPANGDLLVADVGNQYVSRFTSAGAFVDSFNGADTAGGAFQNLLDLTVGTDGVTYVIDLPGGSIDPFFGTISGTSRVERFNATGVSQGGLPNDGGRLSSARSIAYGATSGRVFIVQQGTDSPVTTPTLHVYQGGAPFEDVAYPDDVGANGPSGAVGVAVDDATPSSSGDVYGITDGTQPPQGLVSVQRFDLQRLPDASLDPPANVTPTSMDLSGTVDPVQGTATFDFEYSADGGASWLPAADESPDAGSSASVAHPAAHLHDLLANTEYQVRLVATNADGTNRSTVRTVTTGQTPPVVAAEKATDREVGSATLRATVDPVGLQTTYHLEFGLTADYGSRAPAANEAVAGKGHGPRDVLQLVDGLAPSSTYHFRIVAHNAAGTTTGTDHTFTTPAKQSESGRVYELVSPASKGGNNVQPVIGFQASRGGDALSFGSKTVLSGQGTEAAPLYPRYVARRDDATGWSTRPTDPPQNKGDAFNTTLGVSDDGTKAIVMSTRKLAVGAVEGASNTYLRDVATGAYTTMTTVPGSTYLINEVTTFPREFVAGTPNFDHVLLMGFGVSFLPGVPPGATYEFTGGHLKVVSVAPDGTPLGATEPLSVLAREEYRLSHDGSRAFFTSSGVVYVRVNGTTTKVVSASHRVSDAGTVQPGTFVGADEDGSHAYIFAADLTDDSAPGVESLYDYTVDTGELKLLTAVGSGPVSYQVSATGGTVYFLSQSDLTGDGVPFSYNVYVWRNGALARVATLSTDFAGAWGVYAWRASPNGRYLILAANSQLTGYNPSSTACVNFGDNDTGFTCRQIYRYDADSHQIVCASCPLDGKPATGNASIAPDRADVSGHEFARSVLDDGTVFFDTPDRLSARDSNSTRDVYEFRDGDARLVSAGLAGDSQLADVSLSGRDVFFTTQNKLVAADTDSATDVYDARRGGGIASQNQPVVPAGCSGEDCRIVGSGPTSTEPLPSQAGGRGNRSSSPSRAKISRLTAAFKGTVLNLTLTVSGPGRIHVAGSKVVAATRTSLQAGVYHLKIRLTSKQRTLRRNGHRVTASMTVSFTPVFGPLTKTRFTRTAAAR